MKNLTKIFLTVFLAASFTAAAHSPSAAADKRATTITADQSFVNTEQVGTPANPATGKQKLYFKTDGGLYKLNSAGTETQVDLAASGDSVLIDGVGVVNPDLVSTGQIDVTDTSNTVTFDINDNSIVEADLKAVDAATDEDCLTYESTGGDFEWQPCAGASGDSVSVDSSAVVDPDFVSTGQIDFTDTANTITADINDNSIVEADLKAVDAASDEDCLTYESTGGDFEWQPCAGASGDSVSVDSSAVVDPDFVSTGQIGFTDTANTITADINDNSIVEADLKAVDTPNDEDCFTYEAAGGDFEWQPCTAGALSNILEDVSPQLGGQLDVNTNAIGDGTRELLTFTEDPSAVNHINIENEATGSGPILSAAGDDANIPLNLQGKGTGAVQIGDGQLKFPDSDGTTGQFLKTDGAGNITWATGTGSGLNDVIEDLTPQLGGQLDVNAQCLGDGSLELLCFTETASAVNEVTITNAATGNGPTIAPSGTDTDIPLNLQGKGTGAVQIGDGALKFPDSDGTNNQVLVTDGAGNLSFATQSAASGDLVDDTTPQLGGQLDVNTNAIGDGTRELLTFTEDPSAVNEINIANASTGNGPVISPSGTDANIPLNLQGKGTGAVQIGDGQLKFPDSDGTTGQFLKTDGAGNLTFTDPSASQALKNNVMLNAFRIAVNGGLSRLNMVDGVVDEFEDQNGVDDDNSTNELYDATGDYYSPVKVGDVEQLTGTTEFFIGDQSNVEKRQAQSFTASGSITVSQVDLKFGTRQETPSGDVTVRIETDNSGAPSGTLAHANATKAVTPVDDQVNSFVFPGTFSLSASTKYWIVTTLPDQTVHEKYKVLGSTSSAYSGGGQAESTDSGATWGAESSVNDLYFKVHATGGAPQDMTLISEPVTATTAPDEAHLILFEEDVDSVTLNTDLIAWASRSKQTVTSDSVTDDKLDATAHDLENDDRVMFTTTASDLPAGLDSETVYYVVNKTANDFEVSLTSAGAAVDITDNGTGTHSVHAVTQGTLSDEGDYDTLKQILTSTVDISAQPSDTDMTWFIQSKNSKDLKLHGVALEWN